MLKNFIKTALIQLLEKELDELEKIAASAKEQATDAEMEQEDKWDTRRIEASYLAGAQAKRVEEVKRDLNLIKNLEMIATNEVVSVSNIVEVDHDGDTMVFFMSPTFSNHVVVIEGNEYNCLSIHSPLGKELIGYGMGDIAELEAPSGIQEYEILEIS
jgi:transcription elongation GreA/GreB family factor